MANFFVGGVPVKYSVSSESRCSTLRLVPTLESGVGDLDFLMLAGGVDLELGEASGVPPRLEVIKSLRNRAAKLLVDDSASAWQVAW